jgi:sulfite reductase alpha subunit-like flavoprotein
MRSLESFMSTLLLPSAHIQLTKKFIDDVSVCTNPPDVATIVRERRVVFLVTLPEGENEVMPLITELRSSSDDLSGASYAICLFQNKHSKHQSRVGTLLDAALEGRGAVRLVRTIEIDSNTDDEGEAAFERWTVVVCTTLGLRVPQLSASVVFHLRATRDTSIIESPLRPRTFEVGRVKARSELCPAGCGLVLTRYEIKLPKGLGYGTGSRAIFLPENPPEIADAVVAALGLEPDQPYRLRASHADPEMFVPEQVTPRQLFAQYIDITARPTRTLVKLFSGVVDDETAEELHALVDAAADQRLAEYAQAHTVADFICQYAVHGSPRIEALLSGCPLTRARRYSIASTPKKRRGYLEVVVESRTVDGHPGLCADYLRRIENGRVTVKVEDSNCEYPKDKATPMIVITIGVGISVALGLLEFRKYNEGPFGPLVVIGQFQRKEHAPIIQTVIQEYVDAKLVETVLWAFPEEAEATFHSWQEALEKSVRIVWPIWLDDRCRLYLAGRVRSDAREVREILTRITMTEGGLRDEEASAWTNKHQIFVEDMCDKPKKGGS